MSKIINELNLQNYIDNLIIIIDEYKNNKDNLNINIDSVISDKIGSKLLNKQLECSTISDIIKNKQKEFGKEIREKVFGSIIKKYVRDSEINNIVNNFINLLNKQKGGLFNIIRNEEQLQLAIDIIKNPSTIAISNPLVFIELNNNLASINDANLDMKILFGGKASIDIQNIFIKKIKPIVELSQQFMTDITGENDRYKQMFIVSKFFPKLIQKIEKLIGEDLGNLFKLLIIDKENFYKVFSLIYSKLNEKMKNECRELLTPQDITKFQEILKSQVEFFNENKLSYILQTIKDLIKEKLIKEGVNIISGQPLDEVKEKIVQSGKECLNDPDSCVRKIEKGIKKATDVYKKVQKFIK